MEPEQVVHYEIWGNSWALYPLIDPFITRDLTSMKSLIKQFCG